MIARLERDGLVERRADPSDGRATLVYLTKRARRFEPVAAVVLAELDQLVKRQLSAKRVAALKDALSELMDVHAGRSGQRGSRGVRSNTRMGDRSSMSLDARRTRPAKP